MPGTDMVMKLILWPYVKNFKVQDVRPTNNDSVGVNLILQEYAASAQHSTGSLPRHSLGSSASANTDDQDEHRHSDISGGEQSPR